MKEKQCILCGRKRVSLDEHIETHHNKYDFYQLLSAVTEVFERYDAKLAASIFKKAQHHNRKRLQKRARSMLASGIIVCVGVSLASVGCASTTNSPLLYSMADISRSSVPVHNLRVGVSWFSDRLPKKNPKPSFEVGPALGEIQKGKIGGHIAIVLAKQLRYANVFRETIFVGGDWKKKAPEFDAQLTGTVKLFYSFHEYLPADKVANAAGMFGGGLGGVFGAAAADQILVGLDRRYVSELMLEDVRLIESGTEKVLWSGSVSKRLEGTTSLQKSASGDHAPWKQTLKQAITELIEKLQSAKLQM